MDTNVNYPISSTAGSTVPTFISLNQIQELSSCTPIAGSLNLTSYMHLDLPKNYVLTIYLLIVQIQKLLFVQLKICAQM